MIKKPSLLFLLFIYFVIPLVAQETATYDITFTSIWNATDHTKLPNNPHWSKLVGATHKTNDVFLKIGDLATPGIKQIAETGNPTIFKTEVNTKISNGDADQYINGGNLATATGDILISDFIVKKEFPLLSLVSMIAPSPDWIIALNSYNLLDTQGKWKTSVTLNLFIYDAGTDSGTDYSSQNNVTSPSQPISMSNGSPFNQKKIGTLTITLKTITATNNVFSINQLSVQPNPVSNGKVIISNLKDFTIKEIELLSVSGVSVQSSVDMIDDNISILTIQKPTSGIYILQLITDDNTIIRRKLMIE